MEFGSHLDPEEGELPEELAGATGSSPALSVLCSFFNANAAQVVLF